MKDRYIELRQELGSQEAVAELLGVTSKAISFRERGKTEIKREAMLAIEKLVEDKRRCIEAGISEAADMEDADSV